MDYEKLKTEYNKKVEENKNLQNKHGILFDELNKKMKEQNIIIEFEEDHEQTPVDKFLTNICLNQEKAYGLIEIIKLIVEMNNIEKKIKINDLFKSDYNNFHGLKNKLEKIIN